MFVLGVRGAANGFGFSPTKEFPPSLQLTSNLKQTIRSTGGDSTKDRSDLTAQHSTLHKLSLLSTLQFEKEQEEDS